jgi:hypothetical protein
MRHSTLTAALLLVLLIAPAPSRATVFLPADFSELVVNARAIAHGRIVDVRPRWVEGHRRIESLVTLQVSEYLKGDLGPTVVFMVPGGEIGRYRSVMIGAPVFTEGDEVVLFLNSRAGSLPYVLGLSQGTFRLAPDQRTGRRLVTPAPMMAEGHGPERVVRGDPRRRPLELREFAARVKSVLDRPQPPGGVEGPRRLLPPGDRGAIR